MNRVQSNSPVSQTEIDYVDGVSPEGLKYAPPGRILIDRFYGRAYLKTTRQELNTGWVEFPGVSAPGSSGGVGGMAFVDTFALVRSNVNPSTYVGATSWGYSSAEDGTYRVWRWVSDDVRDDDDATILESDFTSTGRWNQVV